MFVINQTILFQWLANIKKVAQSTSWQAISHRDKKKEMGSNEYITLWVSVFLQCDNSTDKSTLRTANVFAKYSRLSFHERDKKGTWFCARPYLLEHACICVHALHSDQLNKFKPMLENTVTITSCSWYNRCYWKWQSCINIMFQRNLDAHFVSFLVSCIFCYRAWNLLWR